MKNTFGQSVAVTLFGESHGEAIGAVIDGLAPGIEIQEEEIAERLSLRRAQGDLSTARREDDDFRIVSGVYQGKTTGTPICILIENRDQKSGDYEKIASLARPSHADYAAFCKYHGFEDRRGGGHFSGRITAALVAAGAVAQIALKARGIRIGSHLLRIGEVCDRSFSDNEAGLCAELDLTEGDPFPVLDGERKAGMIAQIHAVKAAGDSVGGIVETAITGVPAGVGEPWFDAAESLLAHALFAVPGVKGVEFGGGFALAAMRGSEANDPFRVQAGEIRTATNRSGGINGGITNGMPILLRCALRPTPSIALPQETVDPESRTNATISVGGRHDPCIAPRARAAIEAAAAIVICDLLAQRYGTDFFGEKR